MVITANVAFGMRSCIQQGDMTDLFDKELLVIDAYGGTRCSVVTLLEVGMGGSLMKADTTSINSQRRTYPTRLGVFKPLFFEKGV